MLESLNLIHWRPYDRQVWYHIESDTIIDFNCLAFVWQLTGDFVFIGWLGEED